MADEKKKVLKKVERSHFEQPAEKEASSKPSLVAKKHHVIFHPKTEGTYHKVIAPGDDLSDVPEEYHSALKAEGVI